MIKLQPLTVKMAAASLVLATALLSVGCGPSKTRPASAAANSEQKPVTIGKDAPATVSKSVQDAQAAGKAYGDKAMKDGAAMGAASNGWR